MTERDQPPIPDHDHLSEGALAHRIRSLDEPRLWRPLDYETTHTDRLPARMPLEQRLAAPSWRGQALPASDDTGAHPGSDRCPARQ